MGNKRRQQGATLFIALVMLVVLTLFAVTAINLSNTNLRIAGNMQARAEAEAAAQQAIEQVISSDFTANPVAQSINVDINNDGTTDYTATIPMPVCQSSKPLRNADLDPSIAADAACLSSSTASNTGIISAAAGGTGIQQSWCYKQQWDVQAEVIDSRTGASVKLHQGVFLRVPAGTTC